MENIVKILSCHLENFASYKELDFKFDSQSLTLISGPTGSGKSTICDAVPWILFGRTAKNGTADEVLSWYGGVTKGSVIVHILPKAIIEVVRVRAKGKNDLYFYRQDEGREQKRGKDIQDTQKLINNLLQVNIDLYLSGAYFHEFSQTAQFFTTTAKNRRIICEQIVDLSLAKKLQEKIKYLDKDFHKVIELDIVNTNNLELNIKFLKDLQIAENNKAVNWSKEKKIKQERIEANILKFEDNRTSKLIQAMEDFKNKLDTTKCPTCGAKKEKYVVSNHSKQDHNKILMVIEHEENPYIAQLTDLQTEQNPHSGSIKDFSKDIEKKTVELNELILNTNMHKKELADIEILSSVIMDFRGALIQNTISDLEQQTNLLLNKHFDGEFKINLIISDADKLEVEITKDNNNCSYTQLSKGQRTMLKLCFGTSIMKVIANHHGIKFEQVWFDESLDGCDDSTKIKAYGLLEELSLEYDSIFVVEHSEVFKAMFTNQYKVELINGYSQIERV